MTSQFGVASSQAAPSQRAGRLSQALATDPIAQHLVAVGRVRKASADRLDIVCPFEDQHSGPSSDSATSYFPRFTRGYQFGHFECLHAHCQERTDAEFSAAVGYAPADEFADLRAAGDPKAPVRARFEPIPLAQFATLPEQSWIIDDVLPVGELAVLYGESGAGKSFMAIDMGMCIARGVPWRGKPVQQGRVVYIAAEGSYGARLRLYAYAKHYGLDLGAIPFEVVNAAPNLMLAPEAVELARALGPCAAVIVDTFARVMPGGNENGAEDVGKVIQNCKGIHRATGGIVVAVHHAGKDASKGARGWSGLRAAADAEFEVVRDGHVRDMRVSKQKDGDDGAQFGFRLLVVELPATAAGKLRSSCVVEHTAEKVVRTEKGKTGAVQKKVLQVLGDVCALDSEVGADVLVDLVAAQLPVGEGERDTRKQYARQALRSLIRTEKVAENGPMVRLAEKK